MICESWISQKLYEFNSEQLDEIIQMFDLNFDRLPIDESLIPVFFELMRHDKKVRSGVLNFSLLRRIGKAIHNIEVENDLIADSIRFYINHQ